jgi:RHS repeat-associated protein
LATASWVRVPTTSSAILGETTATFYDAKTRPIRQYTTNFLGGYTYTDNSLDPFSGQLKYSITRHKRLAVDTELLTKDAFTYSAQDRLKTQTHQIGTTGAIELIADNTYDELGQLIYKKVGNNIQKIDYTYNIRGWLTDINDTGALQKAGDPNDLFAFKINYNKPTSITGGKPLYNGNIAETFWSSVSPGNPTIVRGYAYQYDNLNRLRNSIYKRDTAVTNFYDETLTYDKNGNIITIVRNGNNDTALNQIDKLDMTYLSGNKSNQLAKVVDNATTYKGFGFVDSSANTVDDYSYDANGNMTKDNNKNITAIVYNHLNLPTKITFAAAGNIEYIYNASGQKVRKIVTDVTKPTATTDYLGGYQYATVSGVTTLNFFPTSEGYVEPSGSTYKYIYQYKDHLGSIRLSYDKTLTIKEESNYYPFGLKQEGYNIVKIGAENKYKFQGQERQDELGLGWDSFKWRNYDPAIGRFMSLDPLTEKYRDWAPYVFSGNRVVDSRELEGLEPIVATVPLELEFAPETLLAESAGADFTVALEGMTVEAVPRVSMWETVGNFFGELWETVAGGSDVKTDLIPKNAMEGAIDKAKPKANEKEKANDKPYAPDEPLRKQKNGEPKVDSEAEGKKHTQLGTKQGRKGKYTQGREFDEKGNPVKDIDHTDHGRPDTHPDNPHQHTWEPSKTGGTPQRSKLPTKIE